MNIVMSEAVFIDTRGNEYDFHSFFIHARNIRYVHIPDEVCFIIFIHKKCHLYAIWWILMGLKLTKFDWLFMTFFVLEEARIMYF